MLATVIPIHRLPGTGSKLKQMRSRIEFEHQARKRTNLIKLQQEFLQICWRFSVYGATFFDAIAFMSKVMMLLLFFFFFLFLIFDFYFSFKILKYQY